MAKLSYKILLLCRKYKRCKQCQKLMPRQGNIHYCPLCRHLTSSELKIREDFLVWYEREGEALSKILPRPMPKTGEIFRLMKEYKNHE